MLYLVAQMSVFLILAVVVGGATGWAASSARRPRRAPAEGGDSEEQRALVERLRAELAQAQARAANHRDRAHEAEATLARSRQEARLLLHLTTGDQVLGDPLVRARTARAVRDLLLTLGLRQRMAPRFATSLRTTVQTETDFHVTQTMDVSQSGALIHHQGHLGPGTMVEFTIELPDGRGHVQGQARVVRVENAHHASPGIGIQFTDLSAAGARAMLDYFDELQLQVQH